MYMIFITIQCDGISKKVGKVALSGILFGFTKYNTGCPASKYTILGTSYLCLLKSVPLNRQV